MVGTLLSYVTLHLKKHWSPEQICGRLKHEGQPSVSHETIYRFNENHNGLLRQYFPKKSPLNTVSQAQVNLAIDEMNHRPRKSLGYKTPWQFFGNVRTMPQFFFRCCTYVLNLRPN
jgi:IS30 family transposase